MRLTNENNPRCSMVLVRHKMCPQCPRRTRHLRRLREVSSPTPLPQPQQDAGSMPPTVPKEPAPPPQTVTSKDVTGISLQLGPFVPRLNTGIPVTLFRSLVGPLELKRLFTKNLILHYVALRTSGRFDQSTQRISKRTLFHFLIGLNVVRIDSHQHALFPGP